MFNSRRSIISALLFAAALPLHMSDADAAAAPVDTELFYNASTKVIFADVSTRAAEDGITEVAVADVAGLVAAGATIDPSAQAIIDAAPPTTDAVAATPEAVDATAVTPEVAEDPNAVVSSAASNLESDTASSAQSASPSVDTAAQESTAPVPPVPGATFEPVSQVTDAPTTGELTAAASVATPTLAEVPVDDATAAPTDDNTGKVLVDAADHGEAKERFAAVLAALHQFEEDSVEKLKEELSAIGVLLHLHSKASAQASTTGDYQAGDAS